MKRLLLALALIAAPMAAARADDAPAGDHACGLVSALLVSQDQGSVTIGCNGIGEAFGGQLADVMTLILQRRLDPQQVLAKLEELAPVPAANVARDLDGANRQLLIQALVGKPVEQITIAADPKETDAGEYGKEIATALMMVGWQIEGNQISRKEVPTLAAVHGIAVVVRSDANPPPKAAALKAALFAAHVEAPLRADPTLAGDATVLWIGKRPSFDPLEPKT
ncbi:MAG TPA: hypothetical protein VHW66_01155 [Stellaceae bacterium]|nr:hypothetical protein [Stellaceae bacterium]